MLNLRQGNLILISLLTNEIRLPSRDQIAIYHPLTRCFPAHFESAGEAGHRSEPHMRASSQSAFGLFSAGFSRPYLRHHCCFLFSARNKMFQFCAFALASRPSPECELMGCPIRRSTGQRLHASRRSFLQLTTAFVASKAKQFSNQHGS